MLEYDPKTLKFISKPRKNDVKTQETTFDNKWLRARKAANLG